jgi:RNA polymerase sigma-70 factor (ECF subfamily)
MSTNITTSFWLWKAKNKDPEAFAKVYDLYIDKIYRFVYFKVSDQELAQDFTSEVFLKTWEYINTGKEINNLNALLYATARNIVIDHYRRKSQHNVSIDEVIEQTEEVLAVDISEGLMNKIDVQMLEQFLKELKDEYREVLLLKYIEDFDLQEIAQIMGKKNGAVRVLLHRATKSLKDLLEKKQESLGI